MLSYFILFLVSMIPVAATYLICLFLKKTRFKNRNHIVRQIIIGIIFGIISILGTELGIDIGNAGINVRDAAPMCAGILFGAPSGIIAAIIGAAERYIGVMWGLGQFSQAACSLATLFAGVIAAVFRKFVLSKNIPSPIYGLAIGIVTESFHMLMMFITHLDNIEAALEVVENCAVPMIVFNSLSIMLACLVYKFFHKSDPVPELLKSTKKPSISVIFQRYLWVCILGAFLFTCLFSREIFQLVSRNSALSIIDVHLDDVYNEILSVSDESILRNSELVAELIDYKKLDNKLDTDYLKEIAHVYDLSEVNIVDQNGIITMSTNPDYIGFDMKSGEQSSEFCVLLTDNELSYVQPLRATTYDDTVYMKYAASTLKDGGFVQVGYTAKQFQRNLITSIRGITATRHIMKNGIIVIADYDKVIVDGTASNSHYDYIDYSDLDVDAVTSGNENTLTRFEIQDIETYTAYILAEGYYIIAILPSSEVDLSRDISVCLNSFLMVLVFAILFIVVYNSIRRHVIQNVDKLNTSLSGIQSGNLDTVVNVRENAEFDSMSTYINNTVDTLKSYISEAEHRMEADLALARSIQHSALPSVFPPFPSRKDLDIYASMDTAKEVGGDFYDFYFLGRKKLAFLIADVSGKGIPAAMFMMTSKTLLSSYTESRLPLNEVFISTNNKLCEKNDADMFVTAWMGILNTDTGHVEFVNAGHNPPLIHHKDGSWEYLRSKAGLVLAGFEGFPYKTQEMDLQPGDTIFLYTDGVTEATNKDLELYGEERLLAFLNSHEFEDMTQLCKAVKEDLDKFVGDADQFDDITMLGLNYIGTPD